MSTVGKRLRKLRKEKGLTQTEVTGAQYSKEYVSQVELGKTKPSRRAVKLFAKYLDVDEFYFETGVDISGRERLENLMANGEVLIQQKKISEAVRAFEEARDIGEKAESDDLTWRADVGRAWALHSFGKHREALAILTEARVYYEEKHPDSLELAQVLYRTASCREALGDLKLAILLLEGSLRILDKGILPGGRAAHPCSPAYGGDSHAAARPRGGKRSSRSRAGDRQATDRHASRGRSLLGSGNPGGAPTGVRQGHGIRTSSSRSVQGTGRSRRDSEIAG